MAKPVKMNLQVAGDSPWFWASHHQQVDAYIDLLEVMLAVMLYD